MYIRRGIRSLRRRAVDQTPMSLNKRLQARLASIHPSTISRHSEVAEWAIRAAQQGSLSGSGSERAVLLAQHEGLMSELAVNFRSTWSGTWPRVLLHLPPPEVALAWSSNVRNILDGLRYLGIEADVLAWDSSIEESLERFHPNILMTIWHRDYLERIDWELIRRYRKRSPLLIGVNAPEEELYGSEIVDDLLRWSSSTRVSFFFKDRPKTYVQGSYPRLWAAGYEVISLDYGANPLLYHPVQGVAVDLDYVFLGSLHRDKWSRYLSHFSPILSRHAGFLLGPGWPTGPQTTLPSETHRFIYARAAVGLNLHHGAQLSTPVDMNERTYNLAAAGVPQVVDSPMLMKERFSDEAFFCANSAGEFQELFELALKDRREATRRASLAHEEVLKNHTMFHRLAEFLVDLEGIWEGT